MVMAPRGRGVFPRDSDGEHTVTLGSDPRYLFTSQMASDPHKLQFLFHTNMRVFGLHFTSSLNVTQTTLAVGGETCKIQTVGRLTAEPGKATSSLVPCGLEWILPASA